MRQTRTSRRPLARVAVAALSSFVAAAGMLAFSASAQAAPSGANPYNPAYQHPYRHGVVPTREQQAKMNAWDATHAAQAVKPNSTQNLNFGGGVDGIGVTVGAPKVYIIFWGSTWGTQSTDANGNMTFSTDTAGAAPKIQQMFKGVGTGNELWSGIATQYCEGVATGTQICGTSGTHVGYPTGGALAGVWYDNSAVSLTTTEHQIAVEAVAAASHFGNTTPALNRSAQYVVFSPKGAHPDNFNAPLAWCAWHDWNGDTTLIGGPAVSTVGDIAFTNMPYVLDAGASCGQNFVNSGTAGTLDGFTIVEGHEYMETITDQNPAGGYTDSTGAENGDKCAWKTPGTQGGAANVTMGNGSYAEQGGWSNDSVGGTGQCEISHAIVTGGGAGSPTVTNPGNQTGTVGVATSLTMSATGGTPPYTWSATGLPAGLSIASGTGVISGTPTTAGTSSVTVTATDSAAASGSTSFSWTINPAGGCTASQLLGNPGFETGTAAPWTATAGVIDNGTTEPAHSGLWKAKLDGYGVTHTDTLSQSVTIPTGCTSYTLSFWLHIDTAETTTTRVRDQLTVKLGTTTLATYSNLNHNTGFTQVSFNVSSFAGQTVTLTFTGTENSSRQTTFVVDDTALNVA
jgi:hypothetical protein